jgi:hypothetical protein
MPEKAGRSHTQAREALVTAGSALARLDAAAAAAALLLPRRRRVVPASDLAAPVPALLP